MYQLTLPTLLVRDPELIKQITVKDFEHFVDHRSFLPDDADPLWTKNLFSLKGKTVSIINYARTIYENVIL